MLLPVALGFHFALLGQREAVVFVAGFLSSVLGGKLYIKRSISAFSEAVWFWLGFLILQPLSSKFPIQSCLFRHALSSSRHSVVSWLSQEC